MRAALTFALLVSTAALAQPYTPTQGGNVAGFIQQTIPPGSKYASPVGPSNPLSVAGTMTTVPAKAAPANPVSTTIAAANTWQPFIGANTITNGCLIQNYNATASLCVGFPIGSGNAQTAQTGSYACPGTTGGSQVVVLAPLNSTACNGIYTAAIMVASPTVGAGIWGGPN